MPDKNDFGFYGKGLDGYVHYMQSFDRINSNQNNSGKPINNQKDPDEEPGSDFQGKELTWWQVVFLLVVVYGTIFLIVKLRLN